jgi:hypothetical protein
LPLPVLPEVMVIQAALSVALQSQSLAEAVKLKLLVPPSDVNESLVGAMEYVHVTPTWVTVWLCPSTVMVSVLGLELVLGSTE